MFIKLGVFVFVLLVFVLFWSLIGPLSELVPNDPTPENIYQGVFYRDSDTLYAFYKDGSGFTVISSGWVAKDTVRRTPPMHPLALHRIVNK